MDACLVEYILELRKGGECLILALRKRCKNAIERRGRRRNFARRCEINFLPLVYLDGENIEDGKHQLLKCRPNIPGFRVCHQLRTANETFGLFCDPVQENTQRCETTHETIKTSCRVFEICDQAVIISGGWNRWSHHPYHKDNVWNMYKMLQEHGFNRQNIQIFFANGAPGIFGK
ncbi:hypothetical protein LSH36_182g05000 [Paralvinella palmiformis]|uniref:Uncharacterized protein n=1 Tax=Paralvinella palmiformis TaxID=53620 RepID=A0AAD9N5V4_9ANNE|nr:hypothetical protein LSH36_182g05000 [Paralvinella palmiformis]